MVSKRSSAFGGERFSPRVKSMREEIGDIWSDCGISTEWNALKSVILHRPGPEIETLVDADSVQMLDIPNPSTTRDQHDAIADVYRREGVNVYCVKPKGIPPPNLMFQADLMFMTPEGAILARPASTVRAGEERIVAECLAGLGVPILQSIRGNGVFEGADAAWLNHDTVMVATGHRTNQEGAEQVANILIEMGVEVIQVGLPHGSMHLMGTLRLPDEDLAVCWPGKVPYDAVVVLRDLGFDVVFLPDIEEAMKGAPLNFVTVKPMRIFMPGGNPVTQTFLEDLGIMCLSTEVFELLKAAGGIACLTGILEREMRHIAPL